MIFKMIKYTKNEGKKGSKKKDVQMKKKRREKCGKKERGKK